MVDYYTIILVSTICHSIPVHPFSLTCGNTCSWHLSSQQVCIFISCQYLYQMHASNIYHQEKRFAAWNWSKKMYLSQLVTLFNRNHLQIPSTIYDLPSCVWFDITFVLDVGIWTNKQRQEVALTQISYMTHSNVTFVSHFCLYRSVVWLNLLYISLDNNVHIALSRLFNMAFLDCFVYFWK